MDISEFIDVFNVEDDFLELRPGFVILDNSIQAVSGKVLLQFPCSRGELKAFFEQQLLDAELSRLSACEAQGDYSPPDYLKQYYDLEEVDSPWCCTSWGLAQFFGAFGWRHCRTWREDFWVSQYGIYLSNSGRKNREHYIQGSDTSEPVIRFPCDRKELRNVFDFYELKDCIETLDRLEDSHPFYSPLVWDGEQHVRICYAAREIQKKRFPKEPREWVSGDLETVRKNLLSSVNKGELLVFDDAGRNRLEVDEFSSGWLDELGHLVVAVEDLQQWIKNKYKVKVFEDDQASPQESEQALEDDQASPQEIQQELEDDQAIPQEREQALEKLNNGKDISVLLPPRKRETRPGEAVDFLIREYCAANNPSLETLAEASNASLSGAVLKFGKENGWVSYSGILSNKELTDVTVKKEDMCIDVMTSQKSIEGLIGRRFAEIGNAEN